MSDFFKENNNNEESTEVSVDETSKDTIEMDDGYQGFDTVFSDPQAKKPAVKKKNGKKKILSLVAGVLAIVVLAGGTVAVVKLIPDKEEESTSSDFDGISLLEVDSNEFDRVTVKNPNGTFVFNAKKVLKEATDTSEAQPGASDSDKEEYETVWTVEGTDAAKTESSTIAEVMTGLNNLTASREITLKTEEECGLSNPKYKVDVKSEKYGDFSLYIGDESPDGTGVYLKLSTKENIYLADSSVTSDFDFELLDFAESSSFEKMEITEKMEDYVSNDVLSSFDKLTISGANFEDEVVIVPNDDGKLSEYIPYIVTSPTTQIADNVDSLLSLFSDGLIIDGAYSFDVTDKSLKAVGLDKPDIVVKINVADSEKTYKFSIVDDEYCAVVTDDSKLIKRVPLSNVAFYEYNSQSFYSQWVFLRSIDTLSNITFEVENKTYSFDIVYDDSEDAEEEYVITIDGKKLTAENFQNFYEQLVGIKASDFLTEKTDLKPEMTVTATYSKDKSREVLTFTRTSATKYQYSLNGKAMGRVTSSSYSKILKYLKMAANNETIEN